jgi:hypothetical protein
MPAFQDRRWDFAKAKLWPMATTGAAAWALAYWAREVLQPPMRYWWLLPAAFLSGAGSEIALRTLVPRENPTCAYAAVSLAITLALPCWLLVWGGPWRASPFQALAPAVLLAISLGLLQGIRCRRSSRYRSL